MIRQLPPWFANTTKRQIKALKVYFRDTGLLHYLLLGIRSEKELLSHPKSGASWEGYVIEEVLRIVEPVEFYFGVPMAGPRSILCCARMGR
jgi:predicted AAA+ superfamily ATPase